MSIKIIKNYLSKYRNARILILTHGQSVLRTQYFDVIKEYFKKSDIFILDANNTDDVSSKKIIITLPHTIFKLDEKELGNFDLIVVDEAHNFYLVDDGMVQSILNKTRHKSELLLTGSPSKFIAINNATDSKEYEIVSMASSELLQKNVISDVKVLLLQSDDYKFNIYDYHSKNEVRKRKIDVGLTKNVLLEIAQEIYALERKNLDDFSFSKAFKLIKKMIIVAIDEFHAFQIAKILMEIGLKTIISTYSFDVKSEEMDHFKNDPEIRILIVVQRGILGFNFPELQCIIDISLTLNPDKIFQTMSRVVRRFEGRPKLFVKVMPKAIIELAEVSLSCASALSVKEVYESYAGEYNDLLVPVRIREKSESNKNTTEKIDKDSNSKTIQTKKRANIIDIFSFDVMQRIYEEKNLAISKYAWTTFYRARKKLLRNRSWTFEECLKEALKYKTPTEWSNNGRGSYRAAHQYGWFQVCSAHMIQDKRKWTPELCIQEAKKYNVVSQWSKNSIGSYQAAVRFGVLDKCREHMDKLRDNWTPELCIQEATKYFTITEWREKSHNSYQYAHRHDVYQECIAHMRKSRVKWTPELCLKEAKKYSSVKEWKEINLKSYQMASKFRVLPACTKHMISKTKKWNPEECLFEAMKYQTIKDWRLGSNTSYAAAQRFCILDKCKKHMKDPDSKIKKWKPEICIKEAKKYSTRGEWQKYSQGSYAAAKKLGIFDKCVEHMKEPWKKVPLWSKEMCLEKARKYTTLFEWIKNDRNSYRAAERMGILDLCLEHMEEEITFNKKVTWTEKLCLEEALKYDSKIEWINTSPKSYQAAKKFGIIKKCIAHMLNKRFSKWTTKESCLREAKKYMNIRKWRMSSPGSYAAAKRLGFFDECTNHMINKRKVWTPELCIEEAKKHTQVILWRKASNASFNAAVRQGILEECTRHMTKYKRSA